MDIDECLEKGYLSREKVTTDLIEKEIKEGKYDLEKARKAFRDEDYKWTIIKCYYSMFHSAKAVCFKLGYREKRHFAVLIVLENLNKEGKLEIKFVNNFSASISSRENADYRYVYSKERAEESLRITKEFNSRMLQLLKSL